MNKLDRSAIAYINREHSRLTNTSSNYNYNYSNVELYLEHYLDIDNENLREIFAYFHESINRLIRLHNQSNYQTDEDYSYNLQQIDNIFKELKTFQNSLKNTKYAFKIYDSYDKVITQTNEQRYDNLEIVEIYPIAELVNNQALELFKELIEKLYDKNYDLGKTFQSKVRYKSFKENTLTWETMVTDDEKKLLRDNWKYIKDCVHEIFGSEVKIKHIVVNNLDIEANYKINEVSKKKKTSSRKEKIIMKQKFSDDKIDYNFNYKNILLKGVPGTGKSRTLDNIITNYLNLKEEHQETNVLRINIHSASSNVDLMQGIGIISNENGHIEYKEKQGLILEFIEKATFMPNQPFVLVLEEIQENSLNELIGDLIYLIEDSKRAKGYKADKKEYTYGELIDEIIKQYREQNRTIDSVKLPSLISKAEKTKRMIIPENLFIFCTSNYRDDRKVIEDNLLRRFEVIEIYPKNKKSIGDDFKSQEVSDFLEALNKSIVTVCRSNGEIHPDRFMIGHSIWLDVKSKEDFSRAFLKVITEFKDVKDMHFDDFQKIVKNLQFPFEIEREYESYEEWIEVLQNECYDFLKLK